MKSPITCSLKVSIATLIVGVLLLIVSLVLAFAVFPSVVRSQIAEYVRLEEGTKQWERFEEIPVPLQLRAYIFNVTNADEILQGGKPVLQEVGPYEYEQRRKKYGLVLDDEDTVSFYQNQLYEYDQDASGTLKENDTVTFLNIPFMEILQTTERIPNLGIDIDTALGEVFEEPKLFLDVTIKELAFDGIRICDPDRLGLQGRLVCLVITLMNLRNMDYLDDGSIRFSLFHYKNNTHEGYFRMRRGNDDVEKLGEIVEWNNLTRTTFWKDDGNCNDVYGLDSTIYPPYGTTDSVFDIFSTDVCRVMQIKYNGEITYQDIPGYEYAVDENALKSDSPEESCFCINQTRNINGNWSCFLDGVMDLYPCLGVPALLSFPHFLYAEHYTEGLTGLNPSREKHDTFAHLEPNTGTPLKGSKKIQINIVVRPVNTNSESTEYHEITKLLQRVVLPVVWVEEGFALTDEYVQELNERYFDKVAILNGVQWALIAIFAVWTVASGVFAVYKYRSS